MLTITASYVLLTIEVIIDNDGKKWIAQLKETSGIGYTHYFELIVNKKILGKLFKKKDQWTWETTSGQGQELKEQLVFIVEQFIPHKVSIKLK